MSEEKDAGEAAAALAERSDVDITENLDRAKTRKRSGSAKTTRRRKANARR
jgi:hypothetical protein